MLKLLRFLLCGGIVASGIALNAPGLRDAAVGLLAPVAFYGRPPAFLGAIVFGILAVVYVAWLSGATTGGLPMKPWLHAPVILFVGISAVHGPVLRTSTSLPEAQRAMAFAVAETARKVASTTAPNCQAIQTALAGAIAGIAEDGGRYYSHGVALGLQAKSVSSALERDPQSRPGTVQVACNPREVSVSYVILDRLPVGSPLLLPDDVGRPLVFFRELAP